MRAAKSSEDARRTVNLGKLAQTRIIKLSAEIGMDILGASGMLWGDNGSAADRIAEWFVFAPTAASIYGGTDQIQRNVIAERSLGLPREPQSDRGVPFRDYLANLRHAGVSVAQTRAQK
jgi:alkylation response protein AidB-like acyl-CoA dehydrogenase